MLLIMCVPLKVRGSSKEYPLLKVVLSAETLTTFDDLNKLAPLYVAALRVPGVVSAGVCRLGAVSYYLVPAC